MNGNTSISRRAFAAGLALVGLARAPARAQGFAGLGISGEGFAPVTPGKIFSFPDDNGPHPSFRIQRWYVTANLVDSTGPAYAPQRTSFPQPTQPLTHQHAPVHQQRGTPPHA